MIFVQCTFYHFGNIPFTGFLQSRQEHVNLQVSGWILSNPNFEIWPIWNLTIKGFFFPQKQQKQVRFEYSPHMDAAVQRICFWVIESILLRLSRGHVEGIHFLMEVFPGWYHFGVIEPRSWPKSCHCISAEVMSVMIYQGRAFQRHSQGGSTCLSTGCSLVILCAILHSYMIFGFYVCYCQTF